MIVNQLKPWVTSFSEAIVKTYKHGDAVKVGGKIVSILNLGELLSDTKHEEGVYISLDDGVGVNKVVLPLPAYEHYKEKMDLSLGQVIIVEGRVLRLEMTEKGKDLKKKHPEETTRIAAWKITALPAEE